MQVFDKQAAETTGGWPCSVKAKKIKLKVIAAVMNKCKITIEEYMSDREKYLEMCGINLDDLPCSEGEG